jgi:hypothetical protein
MSGKKTHLLSLSGFRVGLNISWLLLAIPIAWSLATGAFPCHLKGLSRAAYWSMGFAEAMGLFLSIVFHGFSRCLPGTVTLKDLLKFLGPQD